MNKNLTSKNGNKKNKGSSAKAELPNSLSHYFINSVNFRKSEKQVSYLEPIRKVRFHRPYERLSLRNLRNGRHFMITVAKVCDRSQGFGEFTDGH